MRGTTLRSWSQQSQGTATAWSGWLGFGQHQSAVECMPAPSQTGSWHGARLGCAGKAVLKPFLRRLPPVDMPVFPVPCVLRNRREEAPPLPRQRYLGALCHSCNIAAQTPKTIPVLLSNGGGYDFHFLLRYIATMGSPVCRAPREELGKDSDNDGTESEAEGKANEEGSDSKSERSMPMAKAAPKGRTKDQGSKAPRG